MKRVKEWLASAVRICYGIWVGAVQWYHTKRTNLKLRRVKWAEAELQKFEADWYSPEKCRCALCKELRGTLADSMIFLPQR